MKINQAYQVSPIYVFFLIHSAQFGAGVLGYSRIIAKKQDMMAGLESYWQVFYIF